MIETIYLAADRYGIRGMWKNLPSLKRGEIPIKVIVTIEEGAFREPVIQKEIIVKDWREGIDIPDTDLTEMVITEEEAEQIRAQRLKRMVEVLEDYGYDVSLPAEASSE